MATQEDIICFFIDHKERWYNRQQIASAMGNRQSLQSITNSLSSLANYNKGTGVSVKMHGRLYHIKRRGKDSSLRSFPRRDSVYALI